MEMRRYYIYSGLIHAAIVLAAFLLIKPVAPSVLPSYTVDFIGGEQPAEVTDAKPAAQPKADEKKAEPEKKPEAVKKPAKKVSSEIRAPKDKAKAREEKPQPKAAAPDEKLAAPSILDDEPPAAQAKTPAADTGGSGATPTGISAEFPNFPYPWYITQVRVALWNEWSSRMPRSGDISCLVSFFVRRDGTVRKIEVERASGNKLFNLAAVTSVENAAPFPPLPAAYKNNELAVHVEFKIAQ